MLDARTGLMATPAALRLAGFHGARPALASWPEQGTPVCPVTPSA